MALFLIIFFAVLLALVVFSGGKAVAGIKFTPSASIFIIIAFIVWTVWPDDPPPERKPRVVRTPAVRTPAVRKNRPRHQKPKETAALGPVETVASASVEPPESSVETTSTYEEACRGIFKPRHLKYLVGKVYRRRAREPEIFKECEGTEGCRDCAKKIIDEAKRMTAAREAKRVTAARHSGGTATVAPIVKVGPRGDRHPIEAAMAMCQTVYPPLPKDLAIGDLLFETMLAVFNKARRMGVPRVELFRTSVESCHKKFSGGEAVGCVICSNELLDLAYPELVYAELVDRGNGG